jgi:hypothetical protein
MDFREAARRTALTMDNDMSMDSNSMSVQESPHAWSGTTDPSTDGMDPASPGGASPYNGAEPFGKPVVENPEWLDPSQGGDRRSHTVPYVPGPTENITTLHNARRAAYAAQGKRNR